MTGEKTKLPIEENGLSFAELKTFLDEQVEKFNAPPFIEKDPIAIPHLFSRLQDIEIAGFFAAILAWGNRQSILNSCQVLLKTMDNAPYDFVENFTTADLKPLSSFVHRTYNGIDLMYTLRFLQKHYQKYTTLEIAFTQFNQEKSTDIRPLLTGFHDYFFSLPGSPERTRKHIATPEKNSACKRLNMYLRWMVRQDRKGVDFGLWHHISPSKLICPLDVHSGGVARRLGLLARKQNDWKAAKMLTENLRQMNKNDPVIYDFALFGLGIIGFNKKN